MASSRKFGFVIFGLLCSVVLTILSTCSSIQYRFMFHVIVDSDKELFC